MWPFNRVNGTERRKESRPKRTLKELDMAHAAVDEELDEELTAFGEDMERTQLRAVAGKGR